MKKIQAAQNKGLAREGSSQGIAIGSGRQPAASGDAPPTESNNNINNNNDREASPPKKKIKKSKGENAGSGMKEKKRKKKSGDKEKEKEKKKSTKKKKSTTSKKPRNNNDNNDDNNNNVDPNFLFVEVGRGNDKAVDKILRIGVSPEILNARHPYEKTVEDASGVTKKHMHITPLHMACEKKHWKIFEMLIEAHGDVNARDSEDNTLLISAVKNGASLSVIKRLIDTGNADVFLANSNAQTAVFFAEDPAVVKYLCGVIQGLYPQIFNMLSGQDEVGKKFAVATIYSASQKNARAVLEINETLWEHLVHLIRFDPSGNSPSSDTDILLPVLASLYNFAIEQKYAVRLGKQQCTFAYLFSLMCKHSSETIQLHAGRAIFALSRFIENKELIATKWFKVLVKLVTNNTNRAAQAQACVIIAETSVNYDKGKEQVMKELGVAKIVELLKTTTHMTPNLCRIVANITNKNKFAQNDVIKAGGTSWLITAVREGAVETALAAMTGMANIIEILFLEKQDKTREEASSAIFANKDVLVKGLLECGGAKSVLTSVDVQEQLARVITALLSSERLVSGLKAQGGTYRPLLEQIISNSKNDRLLRVAKQAKEQL